MAGLVGSPCSSGNKVGKAIVAKNGVVYSFKGSLPLGGQSVVADKSFSWMESSSFF